jgi:hypothetical protein
MNLPRLKYLQVKVLQLHILPPHRKSCQMRLGVAAPSHAAEHYLFSGVGV